ncbi:hypothetical protein ACFVJK_30500 [Streptomyces sp. NPDC127172]|uniref:hypothetical protein n=1 Tax=Streptomyces sp. NPDC127172 TaxID=3345382 RepID=UPI003631122D
MASLLGSSVPFPCPACTAPMTVPLKEVAHNGDVLTVELDLGPFRAHIATAHNREAT